MRSVKHREGVIYQNLKSKIMKRINHTITIKTILLILIFSWVGARAQSNVKDSLSFTIDSKVLGEKRKISIRVPAGMNPYDAYPVLYLLDGEVLSTMVSGQVQYLSEAYKIIPNMIIVGIENTNRMRDLTPTHTDKGPDGKTDTSARSPFHYSGGGERFLEFLQKEVMPMVEIKYKVAPFRILAGHSLGGLMAVYCLLQHPDMFNGYIAISPSLQWDDQSLLKSVAARLNNKKLENKFLFFSDANEDAGFHQNQVVFDSLLQIAKVSFKYKRFFYPEESHISEPVKAFYDGIRFIYPSWHLPFNSSAFRKTLNNSMIREHYEQLTRDYHYTVFPLHDEVVAIARFLRNDPARLKDALELLQNNLSHYPSSPVLLETLGDTFLIAGDKKKASENFSKALQLVPENQDLQRKLKSTRL
jgi:predicted alpha/beta superfamily hydrolase